MPNENPPLLTTIGESPALRQHLARRDVLAMAATALWTVPVAQADMRLDPTLPVPPSSLPARMGKWSAELNETFVSLNARLDGEPAFWFIEGPDYAIVDGHFRPATDRTVMIACRTERRPDGAYAIRHAETVVSVDRDGANAGREILRGPFEWTLNVDAQGVLAQELTLPDKGRRTYRGYCSVARDDERGTWIHEDFEIETVNQAGERDMLIEMHLLKAGPVGSRRSRYVAAESSVLVTRPQLVENERSPGAGYRAASYQGRKYPALDRMLADIPADDRRAHQSFVSEWRRLLR